MSIRRPRPRPPGVAQPKPRDHLVVLSGVMNTFLEEPEFARIVANSTGRSAYEEDVIDYVSNGRHLPRVHDAVALPDPAEVQKMLFLRPGNNVVLLNASPALLNSKVEDPVARQMSNGFDVYQVPSRRAAQLMPHVVRLMQEPPHVM